MQDRVQETDTRVEVLSSGGKDTVSVDKQVGFGSKRNETSARVLDRSTMPDEMNNFYNSIIKRCIILEYTYTSSIYLTVEICDSIIIVLFGLVYFFMH